MCAALHLTRKSLQALDAVASRSRHGELVFSISWEMRKRALEFAWELVARFGDHLQGGSHDHWSCSTFGSKTKSLRTGRSRCRRSQWVVCHERRVSCLRRSTVREMKEGPSRPAVAPHIIEG
jgi:hypothetical protein